MNSTEKTNFGFIVPVILRRIPTIFMTYRMRMGNYNAICIKVRMLIFYRCLRNVEVGK